MERMNRTLSLLLIAGLVGVGSLGAVDPATQPAAADPVVTTPAPTTPAPTNDTTGANQPNQGRNGGGRGNRRGGGGGATGGGGGGGAGGSAPSGSFVNPAGLDKNYAILKTRSIFIKGNQDATERTTQFVPPKNIQANNFTYKKPPSTLVFTGTIVMDDEPNAMIEDRSSNTVTLLKVGDPIAAGTLSSVTFDDLTYEANGNDKKIYLGQNLDGMNAAVAVVSAPPPPSTQPGSPPVAGTADGAAATGAAPATGGSAADDILAKMKAKRNAELGIK